MNKKNFNLLTMLKLRVILCCIIKLYQYNAQIHFDKHCFYKRSIHQLTFTHTHCILPLILFFFSPRPSSSNQKREPCIMTLEDK